MMVDTGVPAAEALLAGTVKSAKFITPQPSFGTIEVGKSADLLLIHGDPLKEISATQKLVMVLARGQVVERLKSSFLLFRQTSGNFQSGDPRVVTEQRDVVVGGQGVSSLKYSVLLTLQWVDPARSEDRLPSERCA